MEEMINSDIVADLKNENEVLKNRCFVLSQGLMCEYCLLKCEHLKAGVKND